MILSRDLMTLKKFRNQIYSAFSSRADATMDLLDALSSNQDANSVVQLSLNSNFKREYGSIRDAISNFGRDPNQSERIQKILGSYCHDITETRPYHLLALDCTSNTREYANTLEDRGIVYKPNPTPSNKPIAVGHQYSVLGFLPEQTQLKQNIPWMLPLDTDRVPTDSNGLLIGLEQINAIMPNFGKDLVVTLGDTAYSAPHFIAGIAKYDNQILIARLRSNRVIQHPPKEKPEKVTKRRQRGHELWYGDAFDFKDDSTWGQPSESFSESFQTRKGKTLLVHIQGWHNMLMRQKKGVALNKYPFTVVRITITDERGNLVYKRPIWLMVSGKQRHSLSLREVWQNYKRRYDIEHFFKFGKARLLMDQFQTPSTSHEVAWWKIAMLSYAQLYLARSLCSNLPNSWEKYLPEMQNNTLVKSARQVQKSFTRITSQTGTPARPPKRRGKPLGRQLGSTQNRRTRHSVVIKQSKKQKLGAA